jgi:hypothetical protein
MGVPVLESYDRGDKACCLSTKKKNEPTVKDYMRTVGEDAIALRRGDTIISNRVTRLVLWVTHYVPFRPFRARSILFHGWNDPISLRLTYSWRSSRSTSSSSTRPSTCGQFGADAT